MKRDCKVLYGNDFFIFRGTQHLRMDIEKGKCVNMLWRFGGGEQRGLLKYSTELLNHGGLGTVARVGITYLTSKCLAGAASLFWVFSDRTLNHVLCSRVVRSMSRQKTLQKNFSSSILVYICYFMNFYSRLHYFKQLFITEKCFHIYYKLDK